MKAINLDAIETLDYETDDGFRQEVQEQAQDLADETQELVEVYSYDGLVFFAAEAI